MQNAYVDDEIQELTEEVQELNKKLMADADEVNAQTVDKEAAKQQGRKRAVSRVSTR